MGLEADAHRKDYFGFFEWQDARLREDRLEFCRCRRVRGRAPADRRKGQSRRALPAGRRESDSEADAGRTREDNRSARAHFENSSWTRAGCSLCQYGALAAGRARARYTSRRREDRSEEHTTELQSRLPSVCRLLLAKNS